MLKFNERKKSGNRVILRVYENGFALLIFVIIVSMSLLLMMIKYSENQKKIADNVREIIKSERALQSSFLCVGQISNILAKYPSLNTDLIDYLQRLEINSPIDNNYWIHNVGANGNGMGVIGQVDANISRYSINGRSGSENYNCKVIELKACDVGSGCSYRSIIEGYSTLGVLSVGGVGKDQFVDEGNRSRIYVEWRLDEYRSYISKLHLINNFIDSLENI